MKKTVSSIWILIFTIILMNFGAVNTRAEDSFHIVIKPIGLVTPEINGTMGLDVSRTKPASSHPKRGIGSISTFDGSAGIDQWFFHRL